MGNVTWSYIAGFFDGEGCIMHTKKPSGRIIPRVLMSQKEDAILYKIKDFLEKYGIEGHIYKMEKSGSSNLDIRRMMSVQIFLNKIVNLLFVKKIKVEEALKMDMGYRRVFKVSEEEFKRAIDLKRGGMTWKEVAKLFGVHRSCLEKRYTKILRGNTELSA